MSSAVPITGTFLDEISHDIPHQNWGEAEWARDFEMMERCGIDTVILIRAGHKRWCTFPSEVLMAREGAYAPPIDLVDLFLRLAHRHHMAFYFGTYDSGRDWYRPDDPEGASMASELSINTDFVDEVWSRFGDRPAFRGWYISQEISRRVGDAVPLIGELATHCKKRSGGLPTLISPYIAGVKADWFADDEASAAGRIDAAAHEREWDGILGELSGAVDTVAFQDGHVDFHELAGYLEINRRLAEKHGFSCWTNAESFDRDMPIRFPPIKWEKLLLKLQAAAAAGIQQAITFEFSHFMSPHSCYPQAHALFDRYCEHFGIQS